MSTRNNWIYVSTILILIVSCNSPKQQKKINDGKLFEKLKAEKGSLNADELLRLERDFSLKLLDKYDLSGYDEEDTLASFLRVGKDVWIASCYLENAAETHYPFLRLTETRERGFKMISHGTIPIAYGECAYELNKLLVRSGEYIFLSQRSNGSTYCDDSPLVFHLNGKKVQKSADFAVAVWNSSDRENNPAQSDFTIESNTPESIVIHVHETTINTEIDEEVGSRDYDLRFGIRDNTIYFRDTVYN
ncbi:hypothetical protein [Fluviicola chungangensis]|uniref:Uncharacterized protein n=1 Tax=Fluviicola chungangensis TaxID=2597671 RepID=A0A556N3J3_9FLAO|nr:hypothetical protein [Fluviicola chungangensis]TSJ46618.1 hypothetical protein FO442_05515 [Fluviicola chungangensis]